jgi:hypothetical protein
LINCLNQSLKWNSDNKRRKQKIKMTIFKVASNSW